MCCHISSTAQQLCWHRGVTTGLLICIVKIVFEGNTVTFNSLCSEMICHLKHKKEAPTQLTVVWQSSMMSPLAKVVIKSSDVKDC